MWLPWRRIPRYLQLQLAAIHVVAPQRVHRCLGFIFMKVADERKARKARGPLRHVEVADLSDALEQAKHGVMV